MKKKNKYTKHLLILSSPNLHEKNVSLGYL